MQHVTRSGVLRVVRAKDLNKNAIHQVQHGGQRGNSNLTFDTDTQPIVKNSDGTRTLRIRKHGNKNLPLPTILDPIAVDARTKHEKPKKRPDYSSDTLTPFQRELSTNIYARALATPVRQCLISKARLPSQLLIPWIQRMIAPKNEEDGSYIWEQATPMLAPTITFKTQQPMGYVYGTEEFIRELPGRQGKWPLLVTERMKRMYALRTQRSVDKVKAREWQLRDGNDVANVVHQRLGENVLSTLKWCFTSEQRLLLPFSGQMAKENVACVVRIGGNTKDLYESVEGSDIFDLEQLLQVEHLQQARELFGSADGAFALIRRTEAVITHLALLKVRQYVTNGKFE